MHHKSQDPGVVVLRDKMVKDLRERLCLIVTEVYEDWKGEGYPPDRLSVWAEAGRIVREEFNAEIVLQAKERERKATS